MTSEVASFSEYPVAWMFWALNLAFVVFTIAAGTFLVLKRKVRFLLPLVVGFGLTHGFRWMRASLTHDYPLPEVARFEGHVDSEGRAIPLLSSTTDIDLIAWSAGLTVLLLVLKKGKEPIQQLEPMRAEGPHGSP